MANLKEIIGWFSIGKTPTAEQFRQSWSSFWHKSEKLPIEQIMGLAEEIAKATTNFKGYHTDEAALKAGYPKAENRKDFFAWVGSKPTLIWKVYENGADWVNTGDEPTEQEIDLAEYAKKETNEGKVVYSIHGGSDFALKHNADGQEVMYSPKTKYIGTENTTGANGIASKNTVVNIDSVLKRDSKITSFGFTIGKHLRNANIVFVVLEKIDDTNFKCINSYIFPITKLGYSEFPVSDNIIYPKGSFIGFYRGDGAGVSTEETSEISGLLLTKKDGIKEGDIIVKTGDARMKYAYNYDIKIVDESDIKNEEKDNTYLNAGLKVFRDASNYISEMRQSPERVEFFTRLADGIDIYPMKYGASNYDMTFSMTHKNKYYELQETHIRFGIELSNGKLYEFGKQTNVSAAPRSMIGVWLNGNTFAPAHNMGVLPSNVRIVNNIRNKKFELYINGTNYITENAVALKTYISVKNSVNEEDRYTVRIVDASADIVSLANSGIDFNQASSFYRWKNYVFAAVVGADSRPILYKTNLETGKIESKVLDGTVDRNRHKYYACIVDKNGVIHIAGNAHAGGVSYSNGDANEISTITQKTGVIIGAVSYPEFILLDDGRLIFMYRTGTSSASYYKPQEYNYNTKVFEPLTEFINGAGKGAYCSLWTKWEEWYYTTYTWRENITGDPNLRNGQVGLIKTKDFITYYSYKDTKLTHPITPNNKECVIDDVPFGVGLHNQWGIIPFVWNNKLMVWYTKQDENGYFNVFFAHPNENNEYIIKKITNFTVTEDFVGGNGMGTFFDACVRNCGEYLEFSYYFEYLGFRTLKFNKLLELVSDEPYIFGEPKTGDMKRETIWREMFNDCTVIDTSEHIMKVDEQPSNRGGNIVII